MSTPWEALQLLDSEHEPSTCILFSAACALYWYCADYHEGQWSEKYSILSARLGYQPGMGKRGPEPESTDQDIYLMLESGELDATELCQWINDEWPMAIAREES